MALCFTGIISRFFERARTDFLQSVGIEQSSTIEANLIFVVRHVSLDYKLPARLDDILSVSCAVKKDPSDAGSFLAVCDSFV